MIDLPAALAHLRRLVEVLQVAQDRGVRLTADTVANLGVAREEFQRFRRLALQAGLGAQLGEYDALYERFDNLAENQEVAHSIGPRVAELRKVLH